MQEAAPLCQTKGAMADFSFSFDSDNPFAEAETAPKPAPVAAPDAASADTATANGEVADGEAVETNGEVSNGEVADGSAFALDDFDFSLDSDLETDPDAGAKIMSGLATGDLTPEEAETLEITSQTETPAALEADPFDFDLPAQESEAIAPLQVAPEEFTAVAAPVDESAVDESAGDESAVDEPIVENAPAESAVEASIVDDVPIEPSFAPPDDAFADEMMSFDLAPTESEASAENAEVVADASLDEVELLSDDDAMPTAEMTMAGEAEFLAIEEKVAPAPLAFADEMPAIAAPETAATPDASPEIAGGMRRTAAAQVLNVAILGASGIGKNHARWFHRNGCRVAAFLGTSEESTQLAHTAMSADFAFEGTAYTDLAALLQTEKPDIVCVATPPALHFGHVLQCLEAGAHVLCEKPLVYAPTRKFRENRDGAKELVKVAAKKKLVLGTQLQYGAATPILCKLAGIAPAEVGDFAMEIETFNANTSRDPKELWIDLGPHPVSIAQMLAGPGASLAEETIRFDPHQSDEKTEVLARFGINCADGRLLMVRAVVRSLDPGAVKRKPRRRFSFNGHAVTYAPLAGPRGTFQAQFIAPDGYASVYPDPVDYLIGNFVHACRGHHAPLISGDFGRENLEWMLKVSAPGEAS